MIMVVNLVLCSQYVLCQWMGTYGQVSKFHVMMVMMKMEIIMMVFNY